MERFPSLKKGLSKLMHVFTFCIESLTATNRKS